MYKIMTLDLKKLLLSRKQNYECVRDFLCSRKEQDAVHLSKKSPMRCDASRVWHLGE